MEMDLQTSPPIGKPHYPLSSGKKRKKADYRSMYKTSPRWFQSYRDRCLSELNQRRQIRQTQLIDQFRKLDPTSQDDRVVQEVMRSVWCQMRTDDPEITDEAMQFHQLHLQNLEEELRQEEGQNELEYWEALDDKKQDEWIASALETQNNVACVMCCRNALTIESLKRIFCSGCGFSFPINFSITSERLSELIRQRLEEHDRCQPQCRSLIGFSSTSSDLQMTCQNCHFVRPLFNVANADSGGKSLMEADSMDDDPD